MAWNKPFDEKEDQFIRKNYPDMGPAEIAEKLGRSRGGVNGRIKALGLRDDAFITRARVMNAPDEQKRTTESLLQVAIRGDEKETLEALRNILASRIDETDSARDTATLAKRLLEVEERISELNVKPGKKKESGAEVTRFDVIAGRNAKRRKTAQA